MISDEDLITVIRAAATEKLPIAVMSLNEMRRFAAAIARDCIWHIEYSRYPINAIEEQYGLPRDQATESETEDSQN